MSSIGGPPPTPEELDPKTPGRPGHLPISEHAEGFTVVPDVPPLPDDATAEQRDLHWYTHVYQGDNVPQLTFRAVIMGGLLGMMMSWSNLYTTMKVGWGFGVTITSCVMSYVIWNVLRAFSGGRLSQMSILENNCMQSTAAAAGVSTGATIATAFGALLILDPNHQHQAWWAVASFTFATAAMGVFLAIPMKRQMINHEQLPFPSGIAAAATLRSLYSEGREAMKRAWSLIVAMVVGAVVGVLNSDEGMFYRLRLFFEWMREKLFNVHLSEQWPEKGFSFFRINDKPTVGAGFEPSVLLIGAGMIVGMRVSLSMLAASFILYFFVAPYLAAIDLAHAGQVDWVTSIPLVGGGKLYNPVRWALWGGTAIMVCSSLTSLALQWKTIVRSFTSFKSADAGTHTVDAGTLQKMADIEVPMTWLVAGMIPITIVMLCVQLFAFHIGVIPGLIAVGMSFVLSLVACRATGETDTTPIGAMGKVMQLLFAFISPGNVTHNLVSAGIAANSASSSADLLTDLKSGYLLGANPRRQFIAQFMGIFFGTLAVVPGWYLMIPNVEALEKFPLPATQTWVAVARVLSKGIESLPPSAIYAVVIGALIGVSLPILEKLFPKARPYLPSAMGLGLGWVVTFSNCFAFVIGAVISLVWQKISASNHDSYNVPVASGLVGGESLMKALMAMTATVIGLTMAPQVTDFQPRVGGPGTVVIVTGKNFEGVTGVRFGKTEAEKFEYVNDDTVRVTVPDKAEADHVVVVTTAGLGSSKETFGAEGAPAPSPEAAPSGGPSGAPLSASPTEVPSGVPSGSPVAPR